MNQIKLPSRYNYIGVFLTFRCNLNCSYCINKYQKLSPTEELSNIGWIDGLSRIVTREDLPITIGGGEPTLHPHFYPIVNKLHHEGKHMDLLTNGEFNTTIFCNRVNPKVFMRRSKYANIRFSFHEKTDEDTMLGQLKSMKDWGYSVGVWGLDSPELYSRSYRMKQMCELNGIDFRMKDFLDHKWEKKIYKYPGATACLSKQKVLCKPSELLISPSGHIYRCHRDLYVGEGSIGHILDKKIRFPQYLPCGNYGHCNPCDVKVKFDRFQRMGHCAVNIKFERR